MVASTNKARTTSGASAVVHSQQLVSLSDTDAYAFAWADALAAASSSSGGSGAYGGTPKVQWGGRGQGGRGRARRTFQPHDIVVDNISLIYPGSSMAPARTLLSGAYLKLLHTHREPEGSGNINIPLSSVYALVGRCGSGKSSLLKRINDGSIPGFPPHLTTLYLPQDLLLDTTPTTTDHVQATAATNTPMEYLMARMGEHQSQFAGAIQSSIRNMEDKIDTELDLTLPDDEARMEDLLQQIALLEEELNLRESNAEREQSAKDALALMGLPLEQMDQPLAKLSPGQRKKVVLSTALVCRPCDLVIFDEPTSHLDVLGLLQLRHMLAELSGASHRTENSKTSKDTSTILIVSHDLDLINDVATNVVEIWDQRLHYYSGNYVDYAKQKHHDEVHHLRQAVAFNKKQAAMKETLQHLKDQPGSKRKGGAKKKAKRIDSYKKKIERAEREQQQEMANSGGAIRVSRAKRVQELLEMKQKFRETPPDKAVQFIFRDPKSEWGEPLILAYEVGLAHNITDSEETRNPENFELVTVSEGDSEAPGVLTFAKKEGFIFDLVDLCIEEGECYCIFGASGSGKSSLLRVLAGVDDPTEGEVKHATNVDIALVYQELPDLMVEAGLRDGAFDAISFLHKSYPSKTEQAIRSELTNFGISPAQATTNLRYLSGGERVRLCFAALMLRDPQVLMLDNPTLNLDVESVEALIYGLKRWKGTIVMVSHDANFVRSMEPSCFVLMAEEGKLRRVVGGMEAYLKSFIPR